MNQKGVRMACPACTWSCVMTHEGDLPPGVNKVVEGVPYCPNCDDLPMKPVASVDTTPRPSPGLAEGLSLAERLAKIREAEQEAADSRADWEEAKERATARKKAYDADVETLCTLIKRLTAVPQPQPRAPLLEEMENPHCLCSHRKEDHAADDTAPDGRGQCAACVCELFELEPATATTATISEHVGTIAEFLDSDPVPDGLRAVALEEMEALRVRLAALHIVVPVAVIDAWTAAEYAEVVAYLDDDAGFLGWPVVLLAALAREDDDEPAVDEVVNEPASEPEAPPPARPSRRKKGYRGDTGYVMKMGAR